MKLKSHFASDEVHIAAHLGRYCRGEQTMDHQVALLIGNDMMNAFIARDLIEKAEVLFSKLPFPVDGVAHFHSLRASDQRTLQMQYYLGNREIDHPGKWR